MTRPRSNPGLIGRAIGFDRADQNAFAAREAEGVGQVVGQVLQLQSEQASALVEPVSSSVARRFRRRLFLGDLFELVDALPNDIRGNGEAESLGRNALRSEGHLGRADPDESAGEIDQRTAAVARD